MAGKGAHLGWMKKGESFIEWKQYKQAINAFDKAIKAKANYPEAWKAKGIALMELEQYSDAVKCFEKLIKLDPETSEHWTLKANALEETGDNVAAKACYKAALDIFPNEVALLFFFGVYLNRREEFAEAIEVFNQVVEVAPDPLVLTGRSHALEKSGQLEAALSDLDRIAIYGEFFMVSQSRGEILEQLERYDEALKAYTAAVNDEPTAAFLWLKKGVLLEQLERYDEALAWYELSITAIGVEGLLMKAHLLQHLKRDPEAILLFEQAQELDPDNASIFYDLAVCQIQENDPTAAITSLEQAIALQPEDIRTMLQEDPAFKSHIDSPEFQQLLSPA